jgi:dUTP pyrophosphatase
MFFFKKLTENASAPKRANSLDAGYDLASSEDMVIKPQERGIVPTGLAISFPANYHNFNLYARIAPRSGLAAKNGIDVFAGVVDAGYRGEIKVIIYNSSSQEFVIKKGDRVAQLILEMIITPNPIEAKELSSSGDERNILGFGSSGVN